MFLLLLCFLCFHCYCIDVFMMCVLSHLNNDYLLTYLLHFVISCSCIVLQLYAVINLFVVTLHYIVCAFYRSRSIKVIDFCTTKRTFHSTTTHWRHRQTFWSAASAPSGCCFRQAPLKTTKTLKKPRITIFALHLFNVATIRKKQLSIQIGDIRELTQRISIEKLN